MNYDEKLTDWRPDGEKHSFDLHVSIFKAQLRSTLVHNTL